ncbi:hypothetical protein LA345_39150 (plasmid) [Burkholderia vietnamiensis]|uniref:Uncharacterized protein n=1 Tax=Burkholderia vietnamiensis (strain G4 / LMG 22486) TaxID=269482 RepID=A4JWI9_BURVG|nr:hypothetical protein Bcep1808_7772 [Burkholderia vietnamiensis G4]MCB4349818.1 hypothetical protein [Burkholderia vietnamiensis]
MSEPIRVQAIISGYQGAAVNLLGALDPKTGLFIVAKEQGIDERSDGALVVSNSTRMEDRDRLFDEDKLQRAIQLFFSLKGQGLLELLAAVTKHDPATRIESDGMSERGTRYRLAPEMSNGNIAVLAMIEAADMALAANTTIDTADDIAQMYGDLDGIDGDWATI